MVSVSSMSLSTFFAHLASSKTGRVLLVAVGMVLGGTGVAHAQTGPGGVGNAGGNGSQPQNVLWLQATDFSGSTWTDLSGNKNDATVVGGSPSKVSNELNGEPTVSFDGDDEFDFSNASNSALVTELPSGDNTVIVVSKRDDGATSADQFVFRAPTGDNNRALAYRLNVQGNTNKPLAAVNGRNFGNDGTSTSSLTATTYNVLHSAYSGTDDSLDVVVNGTVKATATGASNKTPSSALLGRNLSGDIAEVIAFDNTLNAAQIRIVLNYLSARYNIDVKNEDYDYDGSFPEDVAGIGNDQTDLEGAVDGGSHTTAQSSLLRLGVSSFSNDDQFVLFGHDGASLSGSGNTVNGNSETERMSRTWRVDLTGKVERTLDVTIDSTELSNSLPLGSNFNDYGVYVDSDGDFSDGADFYDLSNDNASITVRDGNYITIAKINRTVSFATDAKSDFEPVTDSDPNIIPALNLNLNFPSSVDLTVDLQTVSSNTKSPGATGGGNDFTTCCGTTTGITLAAGNTSYDLNASSPRPFEIEGDGETEKTEYADIELKNLGSTAGLSAGSTTNLVFGIVDEDATIEASFNGTERSGSEEVPDTFTVTVDLRDGGGSLISKTVDLDYELSGSATLGADYERADGINSTTGTLSFSNESQKSFDLNLLDDSDFEGSEEIVVNLSSSDNSDVTLYEDGGGLPELTLTINENESSPTVSFTSNTYSSTEGSNANFTVELTKSSSKDTDVTFSVTAKSAASGDFSQITSSPLTIPAGDTQRDITISYVDDDSIEADETLDVSIDGVTGATLGDPSTAEGGIADDDAVGPDGPGGVGDPESLRAWFRAHEGTPSSGNVSTWADQSGNDNDATAYPGANDPEIISSVGGLNSESAVRFDRGNTEALEVPNLTDVPGRDNTVLVVWNRQGSGTSTQGLIEVAERITGGGKLPQARSIYYNGSDLITANGGVETAAGGDRNPAVLLSHFDESADSLDLVADQDTLGKIASASASSGAYAALGARLYDRDNDNKSADDTPVDFLDADLAEIAVYQRELNQVQRVIVENAMAAKYGFTLSQKDYYAGDTNANGDFDVEVGGIASGGSSAKEKHLDARAGDIEIFTNSFSKGEYVFVGDNTRQDGQNRLNISNVPSEVTARSDSTRFLDTKGQPTFDIKFDLSEMGLRGPAGDPVNYRFLYKDSNGNWSTLSSVGGRSVTDNGQEVRIDGVQMPSADYAGEITIGTTNQAASSLDARLTTVRGTAGADQSDEGWRFYGSPKTGPIQMQEIQLRTPTGKRQSVSPSEANMAYIWDSGRDLDSDNTYGEWVPVTSTTDLPAGRGSIIFLYDDQYYPLDPELTIDVPDSGNNGSYSYTGDTDVLVGDGSPSGDATLRDDVNSHFLANPYEVTYDLGSLQTLNQDGDGDGKNDWTTAVQIWDTTEDTDGGDPRGTYKIRSTDPAKPKSDRLIHPGQAFFLERNDTADDGGGLKSQIEFKAAGRSGSELVNYLGSKSATSTAEAGQIKLRLQVHNSDGDLVARDRAASLYFRSGADSTWDAFDAPKLTPFESSYATIAVKGAGRDGGAALKAQESQPYAISERVTFPLTFTANNVKGRATISASGWWSIPSNWTLTLVDTKGTSDPDDDVEHVLGRDGRNPYTFTVESSKRSESTTRTEASFETRKTPAPPQNIRHGRQLLSKSTSSNESRFRLRVNPRAGSLPVEMADLQAHTDDEAVILQWATASETNNAGFYVEHQRIASGDTTASPQPGEWTRDGFVEGAGTTDSPQEYQHRLSGLDYGRHAFRLQQVDTDGGKTYSRVVKTQVRLGSSHAVGAPYPNPVRQKASLEVTVREAQPVRIEMYDLLGRRVRTVHDEELPGQQTRQIRIRTRSLSSGVYFVRVEGDGFTETRRMTVVQ